MRYFELITITLSAVSLLACGGGNSSAPSTPVTPAPTISMTFAAPNVNVGSSDLLTWSSTNATSCTASGAWSGSQLTLGTLNVTPAVPGKVTYTLTCSGTGGNATKDVALTANATSMSFSNTVTKSANANSLGYEPANVIQAIGEVMFNTGVWGVKAATSYAITQAGTVNLLSGTSDINVSWDIVSSQTPGIVSFTNITYGKHPGATTSSTTKLPVQIAAMPDLNIIGTMETTCLTVCNYGSIMDVFVMKSANATGSDIGTEILIDTEYLSAPQAGYDGTAFIGGIEFKIYRNRIASPWQTIGYRPVQIRKVNNLAINIKDVMADAVARGYITPQEYLVSIEFGNEITFGKGKTIISNLRFQ
jgi:hypothetical protein